MASFLSELVSFWKDLMAALGRGWEAVERLRIPARFRRVVLVLAGTVTALLLLYWLLRSLALDGPGSWVLVVITAIIAVTGSLAVLVGAVLYQMGQRVPGVRLLAQVIATICLGLLILVQVLYLLPHSLPVVLLAVAAALFVALMVVRFGLGPRPQTAYWIYGGLFLVSLARASLAAAMPQTFAAAELAVGGTDSSVARWLETRFAPPPAAIRLETMSDFDDMTFFGVSGPMVYYARSGDGGFDLFNGPGFSPRTGTRLAPVDSLVIREILEWVAGKDLQRAVAAPRPAPRRIDQPINDVEFFDASSGNSLVWYAPGATGRYEMFDGPGVHPGTGETLIPVTRESIGRFRAEVEAQHRADSASVAEQARADSTSIAEQARANEARDRERRRIDQRNRYLNPACVGSGRPVVLVARAGAVDDRITAVLAERLGGRTDCLRQEFTTDGLMSRVLRGDVSAVATLGSASAPLLVTLVELSAADRPVNSAGEAMFRTTLSASTRVLDVSGEVSAEHVSVTSYGLGFSREASLQRAEAAILDSLSVRVMPMVRRPAGGKQ